MVRGYSLSASIAESVLVALGHWAVAGILGASIGALLLILSRSSFRALTPEAAEAGLALAALLLFVRMAAAAVILVAYRAFVPEGFIPFAAGLVGGYLVLYTVELVNYGKGVVRSR